MVVQDSSPSYALMMLILYQPLLEEVTEGLPTTVGTTLYEKLSLVRHNRRRRRRRTRSLAEALESYLAIEHGGGSDDEQVAKELFHPNASLLFIGTSPIDESVLD